MSLVEPSDSVATSDRRTVSPTPISTVSPITDRDVMVGSVADGGSTTVGAVGILGPSSPHAAGQRGDDPDEQQPILLPKRPRDSYGYRGNALQAFP